MRLRLITNFSFLTGNKGEYLAPPSATTVGDLLTHIGKKVGFVFMDVSGKMLRKDVEVVLNGKNILFCPTGLGTALKEGDCVEISELTLGGG